MSQHRAIAVAAALEGKAAFARAGLVLEEATGLRLVSGWRGSEPIGEPLTDEDLRGLVAGEEATMLPSPVLVEAGTMAWVFRGVLLEHGWVSPETYGAIALGGYPGSTLVLVDEMIWGAWVRAELSETMLMFANRTGRELSERCAAAAWQLAPIVTPRHVALRTSLLRELGQHQKAAAFLEMETRYRGREFALRVASDLNGGEPLALGARELNEIGEGFFDALPEDMSDPDDQGDAPGSRGRTA